MDLVIVGFYQNNLHNLRKLSNRSLTDQLYYFSRSAMRINYLLLIEQIQVMVCFIEKVEIFKWRENFINRTKEYEKIIPEFIYRIDSKCNFF